MSFNKTNEDQLCSFELMAWFSLWYASQLRDFLDRCSIANYGHCTTGGLHQDVERALMMIKGNRLYQKPEFKSHGEHLEFYLFLICDYILTKDKNTEWL